MSVDFGQNTPSSSAEMSSHLHNLEDQQNSQIDRLAASVSNQKHIAQNISNEIDEQEPLLDEIMDKTQHVDQHINKTTKKVEKVRLRASDKVSIVVIGILCIALLLVIILAIFV
ncbi:t-SNARE coiled-coil-like proteiny domain-containing protein [Entamoeba marina]